MAPGAPGASIRRYTGLLSIDLPHPMQATMLSSTRAGTLSALRLDLADGGGATVTDYGAHVLSWRPAPDDERLYMSESAVLDGTKPIRGGVPVIFPQFGAFGSGIRHGFARTLAWTREEQRSGRDFATATWVLTAEDPAFQVPARVELTVSLGPRRLDLELHVAHDGTAPFGFTAALHTYLRVNDVAAVSLLGLQDCPYRDQLDEGRMKRQEERHLRIDREVDRIYAEAPSKLELIDAGRTTHVLQDGFADVVVWNPWIERSRAFPDLPADGYRQFVCVEAATVLNPVRLADGETWTGRQTLIAP